MYSSKAIKLYEQGRSFHQEGKLSAAERAYRKAIKLNSNFVEAHNNLGNVLVDNSKLREACVAYKKALKLHPNHPMLQNNIGNALQLQGANEEAIKWFDKAIENEPNYADAHSNLGNALRDIGKHEEAIASFKQAVKIDPNNVDTLNNLGVLLLGLDQLDEAVKYLQDSLRINSNQDEACYELGNALDKKGDCGAAIEEYLRALKLNPDHVDAWVGLGNAYKSQHQFDEAIASYRHAINLDPGFAPAYLGLTTIRGSGDDADLVSLMEQQLQNQNLSSHHRVLLCFAMGQALSNLGRHDSAFDYIREGNRLRWESLDYDVKTDLQYLTWMESAFPAAICDNLRQPEGMDITPVFILGLPRSGKTLAETLLASHPEVHAAGELNYFQHMLLESGDLQDPEGFVGYLLSLPDTELAEIAQKYIEPIRKISGGQPYIVDTMPLNFQYIGFIKLLFPHAKVIHCYRQGMDLCWFNYQKCFRRNRYKYTFDLESLGKYYLGYQRLMDHWHRVFPGFVFDLDYQNMVTSTRQTTSDLATFIGIDDKLLCLEKYENEPLNGDEIEFWRHHQARLGSLQNLLTPDSA